MKTYSDNQPASELGLSTLEVLCALVILSIIVSISVVNLGPVIERQKFHHIEQVVQSAIEEARLESLRAGRNIQLKSFVENRVEHVQVSGRSIVLSTGLCLNGEVMIRSGGKTKTFTMGQFDCRLSEVRSQG